MDNAPDGHFFTCAMISSFEAFSGLIHGLSLGLKTEDNCLAQTPAWIHLSGCHTMLMSSF